MKKYLLLLLCALLINACDEEKPDPRKKYSYHVFIAGKNSGRSFYVGTTRGLGSCAILGRRALLERSQEELANNAWEVVCCWHTRTSQCEEEHLFEDKNMPYDEWLNDPDSHIKPRREYYFKTNRHP